MELELKNVHDKATRYDVIRAFEKVLHGPDLFDPNDTIKWPRGRPPNFEVSLNVNEAGGVGHNGTGFLTLPSKSFGERFLRWLHEEGHSVRVEKQKIRIYRSKGRVRDFVKEQLSKTIYVGPEREEARERVLHELSQDRLRVEKIQFGTIYRPQANAFRMFAAEYEQEFISGSKTAWLDMSYDHKDIHIDLGNRATDDEHYSIIVKWSSIRMMAIGYDFGNPFIVFDLATPAILEEGSFNNQPFRGMIRKKPNALRDRLSALDPAHARVAPYAPHLRVIFFESDAVERFENLCRIAGIEPRPVKPVAGVECSKLNFFSPENLHWIRHWLQRMEWSTAFQLELLLRNGLVTTTELLTDLRSQIDEIRAKYGPDASVILGKFATDLHTRRGPSDMPSPMLQRIVDMFDKDRSQLDRPKLPRGHFYCHHITFTPTRTILEGPNPVQSNRVIRKYQEIDPAFVEHFLRVDFRDEDRLSYRWDREVDGTSFLQQRVGQILKNGFDLGGRTFEFLAYSNSALREHSVWFIHPFQLPSPRPSMPGIFVDGQFIRQSLGNFSNVIYQPSKYAARIAQAFTATDPSVKVTRDQWEEMEDLGDSDNGYLHTDGVGTMSPELRDLAWAELCRGRWDNGTKSVKPSTFQIRFLGYKGMLVVDERLDGIRMRLRPSMRKFVVDNGDDAWLEIARAFDRPNSYALNRPFVMVLEDRGVHRDAFIKLQEQAKKDIYTARDSLENFVNLLRKHGMGFTYHLPFILEQLKAYGLQLEANSADGTKVIQSRFLARVLRFAMNRVLRDIKHRAQIPVPDSYKLVGCADEGQAYIREGLNPEDVYTLDQGRIFACVQENPDEEPKFLKGMCMISRSPVVHPGDVQRVWAVGEPPKDKICFFKNLKNCVVLPATGPRSLASMLGGGDVDGDMFDILIDNPSLMSTIHCEPADYTGAGTYTLDREATVEDICDFVVEYINSDVLGLLSDKHLTIADQSREGTQDHRCIRLAQMCSQAVDYPKNGMAVDISDLPRNLMPYKPDWHKAEVVGPRENDYYESDRALGYLFRNIELLPTQKDAELDVPTKPVDPNADPIRIALTPYVQHALLDYIPLAVRAEGGDTNPRTLFGKYARELRYIRVTHTLTDAPTDILTEEEVFVGAILSNCTQGRWRADRTFRMKTHADMLVKDIRRRLVEDPGKADPQTLQTGLKVAWEAYIWAIEAQAEAAEGDRKITDGQELEGIQSFAWVMLGVVLDCLKRLIADWTPPQAQGLPTPPRSATPSPPPSNSRERGGGRGGRGGHRGRGNGGGGRGGHEGGPGRSHRSGDGRGGRGGGRGRR